MSLFFLMRMKGPNTGFSFMNPVRKILSKSSFSFICECNKEVFWVRSVFQALSLYRDHARHKSSNNFNVDQRKSRKQGQVSPG